jgi:uncharacterized protein Usg
MVVYMCVWLCVYIDWFLLRMVLHGDGPNTTSIYYKQPQHPVNLDL